MDAQFALEGGAVAAFAASALFLQLRGKVHLKWKRQLTDHSTLLAPVNLFMYAFSAASVKPFARVEDHPELLELRKNWKWIREEALRVYELGRIRAADEHDDIAFNTFFERGWKRFYLKWYDEFLPSAEQYCPGTVALLRSLPNVNAALFAVLPPGGVLGAHRDPFAGSLRYHLGLSTPNSDECKIFVDGEPYAWRDGEDALFDETYVHTAFNRTDQARIILFCDYTRPLRTPLARAINRFLIRHVVKISASRNVPTEKVGLMNHFASTVFRLRGVFQRLKRINRRAYYAVKYALMISLAYLVARASFG
jgi:beta-hydroxylase